MMLMASIEKFARLVMAGRLVGTRATAQKQLVADGGCHD